MENENEADNVTGFLDESLHIIYVGLPSRTLWGLGLLCTLTTLLSVLGNISVIVVLTVGKRSRTDLSKFLVNLALADLVMAVFCMPFTFTTALTSNQWIFGQPMCTLVVYMQTASVTASVLTSMVIAVDRYLAITRPLRAKAVVTVHGTILAGIWMVSFATSAVQLFVARTQTVDVDLDFRVTVCQEEWPEPRQSWTRGYTIFVFIVTYLFPLNVIALTYVIVCRKLWNRKCPGNADHVRDSNQLRSTRKIVKMLVTVVTMFGVCWLPLHLFNIHQDLDPRIPSTPDNITSAAVDDGDEEDLGDADDRSFAVFMMVHWLAMSNSFVNPIIYGFLNDAFRSDLRHLASSFLSRSLCCGRWRRRRGPPSIETDPAAACTLQITDSDRHSSSRETSNQDAADPLCNRSLMMITTAARGSGSLVATRTSRGWRSAVGRLQSDKSDLTQHHHHRHHSHHCHHYHQRVHTDPEDLNLTFLDASATRSGLARGQRVRPNIEDNDEGIAEAEDIEKDNID